MDRFVAATLTWFQRRKDDYFKMMHVGYAYGLDAIFYQATLHVFQDWQAVEVQSSWESLPGSEILSETLICICPRYVGGETFLRSS